MMHASRWILAGPLLLGVLSTHPALAAWPALGRAIVTDPNAQENERVASDGAGGVIVVWLDLRSLKVNLFADHVTATGELDPAWPVNGRPVLADSTGLGTGLFTQSQQVVVSDGSGGVIVAWQDGRSAVTQSDIYAQHILASGAIDAAWPANGRALCTDPAGQGVPALVSDGAGGAIVMWLDLRAGADDIFAQHVMANGVVDPAWPVNGLGVSSAGSIPRVVSDGSGGAIVTFVDTRAIDGTADIFAQHVRGSGSLDPAWPAGGRALCLAVHDQEDPVIVSDGAHGAIVAWQDFRDGVFDIYAQRVLDTGAIATGWPVDGRAICTATGNQFDAAIATDGQGGAIVCWEDLRGATQDIDLFAEHVLASGTVDARWPIDGRAITLSSDDPQEASIVEDGAGGAILAWEENALIMAHHVRASGILDKSFPANGRSVKPAATTQNDPVLVTSTQGNAIVAWQDGAPGRETDIYATLVDTHGFVDVDPDPLAAAVTFASPSPSPATGPVLLRFTLPHESSLSLAIYDAMGRRVRALTAGLQTAGEHAVSWDLRDDSGNAAGAGIYFARLEVEGHMLARKLVKSN